MHGNKSTFQKCLTSSCHDEIQNTENQRQQTTHKNKSSPRVGFNDRHSNGSPAVSGNHLGCPNYSIYTSPKLFDALPETILINWCQLSYVSLPWYAKQLSWRAAGLHPWQIGMTASTVRNHRRHRRFSEFLESLGGRFQPSLGSFFVSPPSTKRETTTNN